MQAININLLAQPVCGVNYIRLSYKARALPYKLYPWFTIVLIDTFFQLYCMNCIKTQDFFSLAVLVMHVFFIKTITDLTCCLLIKKN